MSKLYKNSLQKGSIRYIIFQEEGTWYGVGLEFNIVEEAANPQEALFLLLESTRGYLKSAKKSKARVNHILNQKADSEYEELWDRLESAKEKKIKISPKVFTHGIFRNRELAHA